ncbi:MAG: response regulator [Lysobacterales bacterium]
MIRILLVDDHAMVLAGFRLILGQLADIEIVGEADNGESGIQLARQLQPDVVLMDVQMPGISGIEATQRILRGQPQVRILAVTASGDELFARRMLEMGAAGYVTKACPQEELVRAVRQVADGQRYLSVDVARALALRTIEGGGSPFEKLTPRELEVAILIGNGETMPRIAKRLCITAKTVATHKYRVFEKLSVDNDVALTRLALRHGIIDPRP